MPISRGNASTLYAGTNGGSLTWSTPPQAGQKVLVGLWAIPGETITSLVDNGSPSRTFTQDRVESANGIAFYIFRADNVQPSGAYHVTITASGGSTVQAGGVAYSGVATGGPTSTNVGTSAGSSSVSSAAVTPASPGALFFAGFSDTSGLNPETINPPGSSFVSQFTETNGASFDCGAVADKIDPAGPTATTATWTLGDSVPWSAAIAVYDAAPPVGPAPQQSQRLVQLRVPQQQAFAAAPAPPALLPALQQSVLLVARGMATQVPWFQAPPPPPPPPVFPAIPLGLRAELNLGGTWTDVSTRTLKNPIVIGRGHPDESTTAAPTTLSMTLNNEDGVFTSGNPTGPYYGNLRRNTTCRVSVPAALTGVPAYLRMETDQASYASCPDVAPLQITSGTISVRIDCKITDYRQASLIAKYGATGKAWALFLNADGTITFYHFDGTTQWGGESSSTLPYYGQRIALRADYNIGAKTVTYYTAPVMAGPWTQLGVGFTTPAVLQSAGTGQPVQVGTSNFNGMLGEVYEAQVLSSGTLVADPVFTAQTAGTTTFADAQSNTWTMNGTAAITDRAYRVHAETSSWPQDQSPNAGEVLVNVTGGGLLRRIAQRQTTAGSAMYRAYVRAAAALKIVAYWPCEDGTGSTSIASALGGPPMTIYGALPVFGPPNLGANSDFVCSAPLPVMNGGAFVGNVVTPAGFTWTDAVVRFLWECPSAGETNNVAVALINYAGGSVGYVTVIYTTGGNLTMNAYTGVGGTLIHTLGPTAFAVNGQKLRVTVELKKNGSGGTDMLIGTITPGGTAESLVTAAGISGSPPGQVTSVQLGNPGITGSVMGHLSVQGATSNMFDLSFPLNAWNTELAAVRFARLCAEEGFQCRIIGPPLSTQPLGYQGVETVPQLLQEVADADLGMVFEPRQVLGLGYRTRGSIGNQPSVVAMSYQADHLDVYTMPPLEDDQIIVNDVTVTQQTAGVSTTGSSFRLFAAPGQIIDGGILNIQEPPAGAGRYDQTYQANVLVPGTQDNAGMRLFAGTINEPRYPGIGMDLAVTGLGVVLNQAVNADIGDRITITSPPPWLPPGPGNAVDQIIGGYQETLFVRAIFRLSWQGIPYSAYPVAIADDLLYGRADTPGATLHAGISSGALSMQVDCVSDLWTTAVGDFPFDVMMGGERMTVSAISGSSSPQTFTISARSVNGVVKAHLAGEDIRLPYPPVAGL